MTDITSWFPIAGMISAGLLAIIAVYILAIRFMPQLGLPGSKYASKKKDAAAIAGILLLGIALMGGAWTEISSWAPAGGGGGGGGGSTCSPACSMGYACISGSCILTSTECNTETAPTITVSGSVLSDPSTAVATTATIAHRVKGTTAFTQTVYGTGITNYAPGTIIDMYLGNQTGVTGSYYTKHLEMTVPCQQTVAVSGDLGLEATVGNIASYYKNDQGTANTAIDIAAGATKTGYITLTGEYHHSFGNMECGANSNVMAVYYNRSQIQTIRIGDWAEVGCPGVVPTSTVSNNVTKCFYAPVLTSDQTTGEVALTLQADASNNPAQDLHMVLFDSNWYRNTVTGEYACGVSTNANADVGASSTTTPMINVLIT